MFLSWQITYAQNQVSDVHQKTTTPSEARYEIVQSELAAKWTFRLDRYTGKVYQLVRTPDEENAWDEMTVTNLQKIKNPIKPRFLIFTSGLAARHTFLMDTFMGKTWTLTASTIPIGEGQTIKVTGWEPFK